MKGIRFLKDLVIFFLTLGVSAALAAEQIKLNDTGVDWCSTSEDVELACPQTDYPRQDGEFGRDALAKADKLVKKGGGRAGFDFTKIDQEGKPLPSDAKKWHCVLDNHTGLMWEVKTTDDGLHDMDNRYTWYNPDDKTNGGDPGIQDGAKCKGSRCDTQGFVMAVNEQGLCGHKDWHVPTLVELQSIVDYSRRLPSLDTDYFPHTPVVPFSSDEASVEFWASETWPQLPNNAWSIDFRAALISYRHKDLITLQVRLVRKADAPQVKPTESSTTGGR